MKRLFKYILIIAQALASLVFLVSIFSLNIIDGELLMLLSFVFVALLGLSIIKLILKKNTPLPTQIIFSLISILTIIAALVAFRYTDAANSFLNNITNQSAETKEYSVLVLKNNPATKISDLQNQTIGFLKADPDTAKVTAELKNVLNYTAEFSDTIDSLSLSLTTESIPAIVLESSRYDALFEAEMEMAKVTKIIYRFNIALDSPMPKVTPEPITQPFIIYISGSDSRTGIQTASPSDVNILAAVNPEQHKILLVSIPRDTYVQLHDTTGIKDKLTHAGIYGTHMSKATIEDFLGIKINHTIKVSFETVIKIVDQIDGITINSDQAMTLKTGPGSANNQNKICTYVVGPQQVDGDCALRFARERKSYATGDLHRGENQQQVLTSIIDKLTTSRSYLSKLPEILDIAASSFETSFSRDDISGLIRYQLDSSQAWQIESISVIGTGAMQPTYSMGANLPLYVMIPSPESVENAKKQLEAYLSTSVDN